MKFYILTLATLFTAALAFAQVTEPNAPVCAVQVDIVIHSYEGPIHIEDVCLSQPAVYSNGVLVLDLIDDSSSVFRNGFDPL